MMHEFQTFPDGYSSHILKHILKKKMKNTFDILPVVGEKGDATRPKISHF